MRDAKLVAKIAGEFASFGGGRVHGAEFNPLVGALADGPVVFAAGVDVAAVVDAVLVESGYDGLLWAARNALAKVESLSPRSCVVGSLRAAIDNAEGH